MMNKLKQTIDKILDDVYERRLKTMSYEAEDMIIAEIEDLEQILDLIREEEQQQSQCLAFWMRGHLGGEDAYVCSKCGAGFTGSNRAEIAYNHKYCPKCGSKMDLSMVEFDGDTWGVD